MNLFSLVKTQLALEWSEKERFFSPLFFALTVLLLFNFAFGDMDKQHAHVIFVGETFLAVLLASQMMTYRIWDFEMRDHLFEQLRLRRAHSLNLFISKLLICVLVCAWTLLPTMLLSSLFHGQPWMQYLSFSSVGVVILTFANIMAVGILLSALTFQASNRDILFPILYFPLISPLLIIGVQALLSAVQPPVPDSMNWGLLLVGISLIYLTLTVLLFSEYFDSL